MVGSSSVVVWAGCAALPRSTDTTLVGVNEFTECDIMDQLDTIKGMPVYYGGDLYDLEDSDWDDPYEIASGAYVEDYNFDGGFGPLSHWGCGGVGMRSNMELRPLGCHSSGRSYRRQR